MSRRAALALLADVAAVAVFVVLGRRSHQESGNAIAGALRVMAPFVIALLIGWIAARADRAPLTIRSGTMIWVCTVVLGLALRRLVFDRGIATGFIIVTTIVLGVLLVGWRAIARVRQRPV